jgi:signal peptidase
MTTSAPNRPHDLTLGPLPRGTAAALARAGRGVSTVVVVVMFLACAFISVGTLTGHWALLSVPTASMEPTIPAGAGIVVVPTSVREVAVGDIIVFRAPETNVLTVHRVKAIERKAGAPVFQTQGDANPVRDPWEVKVDGPTVDRVVSVSPSLGAFTSILGDRVVRLGAAGLGAIMVLAAGLGAIWGARPPADEQRRTASPEERSG